MAKVVLEPYIFFKGNAREAMEFYKSIFGGTLNVTTYEEAHSADMAGGKDWLMHASLEGGEVKLMGSDTEQASPEAKKVSLSLGGTDEAKMCAIFDQLAKDGNVRQPLEKASWGDTFGSLTDRYGVDWMMNIGANV